MTAPATVGVVGLGLIGGSLARALRAAGHRVLASTRSPEARRGAAAAGIEIVEAPTDLVGPCDVIVLAVPLSAMPQAIADLGRTIGAAPGGTTIPTVTDVGSVKRGVADAAAALPDPSIVVPGHPMAGTEHVGWDASDATLFGGARWALAVDAPVDLGRWVAVARVALAAGAEVVPVAVAEHDAAVALTSHLPYVLAATVAGALDGSASSALARSLAAGSFADVTRVAGGHPTLGAEMAVANRQPLRERLADLRTALAEIEAALSDDDRATVDAAFRAGHEGRAWLDRRGADDGPAIDVAVDRDGLLDVGRRGGRVVAVGDLAADGRVAVTVVGPEVAR